MDLFGLFAHAKPGAAAVFCSDSDSGADAEDDGPFFDLDFALPLHHHDDDDDTRRRENNNQQSDAEEFDLEMSPSCGGSLRRDAALSLSPSDDLFDSAASNKSVPGFLVKSAARIRSFHLGLRRESKSSASIDPGPKPPASLFGRDSSSRSSGSSRSARLYADDWLPASDERKLPGDVLQKYLKKIKPLYVQISKRYGERLHFSGPLSSGWAGKVLPAAEGGDAAGDGDSQLKEKASAVATRVVSQRLRKSRSASAAKQDDSLLEQQDGIQSAIAHCKRSFNRAYGRVNSVMRRSRSDSGGGGR